MIRKRQVGALHAHQLYKRWAGNERVSVRAARCALVRKVKTGGLYICESSTATSIDLRDGGRLVGSFPAR